MERDGMRDGLGYWESQVSLDCYSSRSSGRYMGSGASLAQLLYTHEGWRWGPLVPTATLSPLLRERRFLLFYIGSLING